MFSKARTRARVRGRAMHVGTCAESQLGCTWHVVAAISVALLFHQCLHEMVPVRDGPMPGPFLPQASSLFATIATSDRSKGPCARSTSVWRCGRISWLLTCELRGTRHTPATKLEGVCICAQRSERRTTRPWQTILALNGHTRTRQHVKNPCEDYALFPTRTS